MKHNDEHGSNATNLAAAAVAVAAVAVAAAAAAAAVVVAAAAAAAAAQLVHHSCFSLDTEIDCIHYSEVSFEGCDEDSGHHWKESHSCRPILRPTGQGTQMRTITSNIETRVTNMNESMVL